MRTRREHEAKRLKSAFFKELTRANPIVSHPRTSVQSVLEYLNLLEIKIDQSVTSSNVSHRS